MDSLTRTPPAGDLLAKKTLWLAEDYQLRYALGVETSGSACLLGQDFTNPFAYTLSVVRDGVRREIPVDLPETFNYLIGLHVESRRQIDGVLAITGTDAEGRKCLILWRNLDEMDSSALDAWFARNRKQFTPPPPPRMYHIRQRRPYTERHETTRRNLDCRNHRTGFPETDVWRITMTKSENHNEFYNMTFSQREGKAPLPEPMQLGCIPHSFRQIVHMVIEKEILESYHMQRYNMKHILIKYRFHMHGKYSDEIQSQSSRDSDIDLCRECIKNKKYDKVLTLVEYILRSEACSRSLRENLMGAFDSTPVAYFVQEINGLPTIMPRASREAGEATQQAIETLRATGMDPATTHLRQAAEHINAKQFPDSVHDSISAVESVARRIAPNSSSLGDALNILERKKLLNNKELKAGFEKIYAYTNSEEGIRHAKVLQKSSDVDIDEAMFMFGACASFAAYLASKHQQTK